MRKVLWRKDGEALSWSCQFCNGDLSSKHSYLRDRKGKVLEQRVRTVFCQHIGVTESQGQCVEREWQKTKNISLMDPNGLKKN